MHPDVAKLVESGRIAPEVGERLTQISPGSFCLHKSWGSGKVLEWDLFAGKVTINLEREPNRVMGLKLALEKTEPLQSDDFRASKLDQVEELKELAQTDPAQVVIRTLQSHNGSMKPDQIDRELCGSIIPEKGYKKWWDKAKKAMREGRQVIVPTKRTEPLVLRDTDLSAVETLMADFDEATNPKVKSKILDEFKKEAEDLDKESTLVEKLLSDVDSVVSKGSKLNLGGVLDLLAGRDELFEALKEHRLPDNALRLQDVLAKSDLPIAPEMAGLPAARQRRIYQSFPDAFGSDWVKKILEVFDRVGSRGVAEIAKLFDDLGETPKLLEHVKVALSRHALGPDALGWICRERKRAAQDVFGHEVGATILSVVDQDATDEGPRRSLRLQNLLMEDRELIGDLLEGVDINDARNFGRKLLQSPAFPELDRKSLMARVIKVHPETQDLVLGQTGPVKETFIVSAESLDKRKAEYEDLVNNRIPQNNKDIAVARSYGDLRENFEYKAAKQMQAVLQRRREELERDLSNAQVTDFKGADTATVNIGTIATLTGDDGSEVVFTILGAWDSDPEKKILSYLSEIGQALVGSAVGEEVEFTDLETEQLRQYTLKSIQSYI